MIILLLLFAFITVLILTSFLVAHLIHRKDQLT